MESKLYLRSVSLAKAVDGSRFPFSLPLLKGLPLEFLKPVTFFVGENGSGKSTLIEAIAEKCGFPVSGGSRNELAESHGPESHGPGATSELAPALRASFRVKPRDGYFLRTEFQAGFASLLDRRASDPEFLGDPYRLYGGKSLHTRSHGEALLAMIRNRIRSGLYFMDEPESALSPARQLTLLAQVARLVATDKTQFVIATHSPILLTYPDADIVSFDDGMLRRVELEQTSHYQITRGILESPDLYWRHLLEEP